MIKLPDTVVLHLQIPGNVCFLETITDKQIIIVIIKKDSWVVYILCCTAATHVVNQSVTSQLNPPI